MNMSKTSEGWQTLGDGAPKNGIYAFYMNRDRRWVAKLTQVETTEEADSLYRELGPLGYDYQGARQLNKGDSMVLRS